MENDKEKKLKTLPVLLLQLYPQYKAIRIIYLWLKDDLSWSEEKLKLERELGNIGKNQIGISGSLKAKSQTVQFVL